MEVEAVPVLRVDDAARAVAWYARLGSEPDWEHRFGPGMPAFVSPARDGTAWLFLSEHLGDARPDTLVYLRLPHLDAVAAEFSVEVHEQPWGGEVHFLDPDGNRLRVGAPSA